MKTNLLKELNSVKPTTDSQPYTKPEMYDKNYRGAMKRYKMIDGVEHTEDSKGQWTPIMFTASVGQMPSIMGDADNATRIRKEATRDALQEELEKAGYFDLTLSDIVTLSNNDVKKGEQIKSLSSDVKYQLVQKKRRIFYECQDKVKHIGDKAVAEWTQMQLEGYLSGERELEPREYDVSEQDAFSEDKNDY